MNALFRRIEELRSLHIRLHVLRGKVVTAADGICRGVEQGCIVLEPSSRGERAAICLEQVGAVTQLPGDLRR